MTRTIRTAALQLQATARHAFADAWPRHLMAIEDAARQNDLLVLPEASIPAYVLGDDRIADAAIERAVEQVRSIARRYGTVIVAGVAQREGLRLRNRALVIERDGAIAGHADKLFLWHFDRKWFEAGNAIEPVSTSLGTLGVLVCADGRLPGIASALVDQGAELLVMPTAWVTSGRDPDHLENAQADLIVRVRAFENGVPFVAANKCGVELNMVAYCGKSQIIAADGAVLAIASERDQVCITRTLEIGAASPHRSPPADDAPAQPYANGAASLRIAISLDTPDQDTEGRLATIDAHFLLTPQSEPATEQRLLEAGLPLARCSESDGFDPGYLASLRRIGYRAAAWSVLRSSPWIEPVARVRAIELRIYVIVFDLQAGHAYAIDPDGSIVAGTFGDYRMPSLSLDLRRTMQTSVAPDTDIADGLERVHAVIAGRP